MNLLRVLGVSTSGDGGSIARIGNMLDTQWIPIPTDFTLTASIESFAIFLQLLLYVVSFQD